MIPGNLNCCGEISKKVCLAGEENFIRGLEKIAGRLLRYRPLGRPRGEEREQ